MATQPLNPGEELVGIVGTFSFAEETDILPDIKERILFEDIDFPPLATFMSRIQGTEPAHNTTFKWMESIIDKFAVTTSSFNATSAGDETANVTFQSPGMRVGDVIHHPGTGQKYQLTTYVSRTSTTSVFKCVRVPFSLAGSAITGTPTFRVLGNHILEGQWLPIGQGVKPTFYSNYTQPLVEVATISRTMKEVATWWGSVFELDNMAAAQRLYADQERILIFGEGVEEDHAFTNEEGYSSEGVYRSTAGLHANITSIFPYSGDLDKATLNAWYYGPVFGGRNSGQRKMMQLTGMNVFAAFDDIANQQLRYLPEISTALGVDVNAVKVAGQRQVALVEEREYMNDVDASEYADTATIVYPDLLAIRQLGANFMRVGPINMGPRISEGIEYYSEFGLEFKGRGKHHMLTKTPS